MGHYCQHCRGERANCCNFQSRRTLFSALHGTYTVMLSEFSLFGRQAHRHDRPVTRKTASQKRKRHTTEEVTCTSKKAALPTTLVDTYGGRKEVVTRKIFAPLPRSTNVSTDSNVTEFTLSEEAVPAKRGRPPTVVLMYVANFIQFQKQQKQQRNGPVHVLATYFTCLQNRPF